MLYAVNALIVVLTVLSLLPAWRKDGTWDIASGRRSLQFFTVQSNLLCGLSSLLLLLTLRQGIPPRWVWLLRYLGTASVTVTFLTVMVFLGPTQGYKSQLDGWGLSLHLVAPLLSVLSFCVWERFYSLPFGLSLIAILPVLLYGLVYLHLVVRVKKWEDFYGFNRGGKWPVSFTAMMVGAFLVCLLLYFLYTV